MGSLPDNRGMALLADRRTATFVLTEDCNLRCRYCYMVRKNHKRRMPFEIAKAAIDYLISDRGLFFNRNMIWEFIGGEPLLEVGLIEQIINYINFRTYETQHPWFTASTFSFSTNGTLYANPEFQRLLKQHSNFDVGLTIDGPAHVHDAMRVYVDGRGSHADTARNVALWLKQFPRRSTKVTVSHETLPYVAESILYLFNLGIPIVHSNVVFENVWQPGDDEIFESQLDILGATMIEKELWKQHECSFFTRHIGRPLGKEDTNWCGAGKYMLAVDAAGIFYPCVRFMDFSLHRRPGLMIGDVRTGVDKNKLAPFLTLTRSCQSTKECMECKVASGCAWCQGFNYDDSGILAHRATYICKMHKARVRANEKFWAAFDKQEAQQCPK